MKGSRPVPRSGSDCGYVLETGCIVLDGRADELLGNQEVQRDYLGKGYREVWE